jgi:hypothetical protein
MEQKIKIGYLDESPGNRSTFLRLFKKDFDVTFFDDPIKISTLDKLVTQIDDSKIEALAVDYKLADGGWVDYNGDQVVDKLWECKRYFPVFILTSYTPEAIRKAKNAFLVNDKEVFTNENALNLLIIKIKSTVKSYHKIVSNKEKRIKALEDKQKETAGGLSESEERELFKLHLEMSYIDSKANPISPEMLETKNVKELHNMVDLTRKLLDSINKGRNDIS